MAPRRDRREGAPRRLQAVGYRRGKRAGEALATRAFLETRFQKITPSVDKKLNAASIEELERWLLAAVDAKTLRDVFKP